MRKSLFVLPLFGLLLAMAPPSLYSQAGAVASDHILASQVGAEILAKGGNAVDAIIATALAAGVVQPAGSGFGGGGFALVQEGSENAFVLDFRERAPSAATRDMYVNNPRPKASRNGGLAVAIPNESNGLIALHAKYGTMSLKQLSKPAIRLSKGYPVGLYVLKSLGKLAEREAAFTQSYWGMSERPAQNSMVSNPRLGKALKDWARTGGEAFKTGWVAEDLVATVQADGGILSKEDLTNVSAKEREPLVGEYRGWKIYTMPPPSSGGVVLLQMLKVLEGYDLSSYGHNSAELIHLYAEVSQHAFSDRANHLGDPDRIQIPIQELLAPERIKEIQDSFQKEQTLSAESYGTKLDIGKDSGTQHISVIDKNGLSASLTTTLNTYFGSTVVGERSGIILNNEMDDFVAEPGKANFYGLIGSEANSVAPGAVPLSSMTPTILVSSDGRQRISVGASGGPFIISATMQTIINIIDFEMEPSRAIAEPRTHHQWAPRKIFIDQGVSEDTQEKLKEKGHQLKPMPLDSSVQIIHCTDMYCLSASDPRKGGRPASPESL